MNFSKKIRYIILKKINLIAYIFNIQKQSVTTVTNYYAINLKN